MVINETVTTGNKWRGKWSQIMYQFVINTA